ncbi:MAG: TcfC E-set like domain-containing protein [Alcanivorax sp.]|nr:TcfC E-set like domain-containing protein [Alcanivorax sp.]
MQRIGWILSGIWLAMLGPLAVAAEPPTDTAMAVPPGFESFTQPQKTLVEVYFSGQYVLDAWVTFTPQSLTFLHPATVVARLPDIKDRQPLQNALTGSLPTHGDRVCVTQTQKNCGVLHPKTAAIIFDEQRFRVDVFVGPDYYVAANQVPPRYLPLPEQPRWGLVQNLSANQAGRSDGPDRYSLFGRTLVGQGPQHVFSSWNSTNDQSFAMDELGWQRDYQDHRVRAGLFQPELDQLTMVARQPIAGVGIRRSLARRQDLDEAFATDLDVFLSSRSRVELYKDGRLYSASFYEAGHRYLHTDRLPTGAYPVEVRITDASGATRTLTRFFVKSRRLAPAGEPLWFADVGRVYAYDRTRMLPQDDGAFVGMAGWRYRRSDSLGLGVAGAVTDREGLLEVSSDWFTHPAELSSSVFIGSSGAGGYVLRGTAHGDWWRLVMDSQRVTAGDPPPSGEYALLPRELQRDSVEIRVPALGGQLSLSHRRYRLSGADSQQATTLLYLRTLRVAGHQNLNMSVSLANVDGDNQFLLGLDWLYARPDWQHQASLAWLNDGHNSDNSGARASFRSSWNDQERFASDVRLAGGASLEPQVNSVFAEGDQRSQYGHLQGGVTLSNRNGQGTQTLTSLGYDTSLVAGDGLALGGTQANPAAVLLKLDGAKGAQFDVLVDGHPYTVVRGGGAATLTLPAFKAYQISLRDRGTDFVDYDNKPRKVVLYPGNVKTLSWRLERVVVALGKLVDADSGKPLGNARLDGSGHLVFTDQDGYFQVELAEDKLAGLTASTPGEDCKLDTGKLPAVVNGVVRLGVVACRRSR